MGELTAQFELQLLDQMSGPLQKILSRIEEVTGKLASIADAASGGEAVNRSLSEVAETSEKLSENFRTTTAASDGLNEALGNTTRKGAATHQTLADIEKSASKIGETVSVASGASDGFNEVLGDTVKNGERARQALSDVEVVTGRINSTIGGAASTTEGLNEALSSTAGASEAATSGIGTVVDEVTQLEERASASLGVLGRLKAAMGGMGGGGGFGGGFGHLHEAAHGFHERFDAAQSRGFGALMGGFELLEPAKEAAEYDNTIRHVGIGLEIHGDALDQYVASEKVKINELARSTGQRSGELAEALGFFSREGFRGRELDDSLGTTAKIATAYNAKPESVARSAFALKENMGIDDKHLQGALASIAIAGKQADLPFENLAPLLPELAAAAGALGIKGRSGVDDLAAATAVVRKSTGTDGEAVTRGKDFLQTITSAHGAKRWAKAFHNEDLFGLEARARATGHDPMMVVMERIRTLVNRVGNRDKALSMLFNNMNDKGFASALLDHWDQYTSIHKLVAGADQHVIDRDYADGKKSGLISVQAFEDSLMQLLRRVGDDFTPILNKLTVGINDVNQGLEWMDRHCKGLSTVLIGGVGAILAVTTVAGALGAVLGLVGAGFSALGVVLGVIASPAVAAVAAIAAVTVGLYEAVTHWEKVGAFFQKMGANISDFLARVGKAIVDIFHHIISSIAQLLPKAMQGAVSGWHNIVASWNTAPKIDPAHLGKDGKTKKLVSPEEQFRLDVEASAKRAKTAITAPAQQVRPHAPVTHRHNHRHAHRHTHAPALARPVQATTHTLAGTIKLKVEAADNLKVTAHSDNRAPVTIEHAVTGGAMMGRP